MKNRISSTLVVALLAVGCGTGSDDSTGYSTAEPASAAVVSARAELSPTESSQAAGSVTFTEVPDGVRVTVSLQGLEPGRHGFHVHETGDCSAPDATSAGGHFAPQGSPHGAPRDPAGSRHAGDLGNVTSDEQGRVETEFIDPVLSLQGDRSIVGRAVIVHAGEDDLESQPTGNAGARVACGVIERSED